MDARGVTGRDCSVLPEFSEGKRLQGVRRRGKTKFNAVFGRFSTLVLFDSFYHIKGLYSDADIFGKILYNKNNCQTIEKL